MFEKYGIKGYLKPLVVNQLKEPSSSIPSGTHAFFSIFINIFLPIGWNWKSFSRFLAVSLMPRKRLFLFSTTDYVSWCIFQCSARNWWSHHNSFHSLRTQPAVSDLHPSNHQTLFKMICNLFSQRTLFFRQHRFIFLFYRTDLLSNFTLRSDL